MLVSLLVTQVFLFRIEEWAATVGLLADLAVLGLVAAELSQMDAERRDGRRWAGRVGRCDRVLTARRRAGGL